MEEETPLEIVTRTLDMVEEEYNCLLEDFKKEKDEKKFARRMIFFTMGTIMLFQIKDINGNVGKLKNYPDNDLIAFRVKNILDICAKQREMGY
jgi:hypothetical protein